MQINKILSIVSFIAFLLICSLNQSNAQALNGSYTVGGTSPDFTTLQDAAHALFINGMSGPVNINIRPGTYSRDNPPKPVLIIDSSIAGLSEVNRLTFQPDGTSGGTVENVILQIDCNNSTGSTDKEVIYNFRDYVTFKNLTLFDADSMDTPAGYLLRIGTGLNSGNPSIEGLIVEGCRLIGQTPYMVGNQLLGTVNGIDGSNITDAEVSNNEMIHLRNGISLNASSAVGENVDITDNRMENIFNSGNAMFIGFRDVEIQRNYIDAAFQGIQIASPQTGIVNANYAAAGDLGGYVLEVDGHNVTDSLLIKNNILIRRNLGDPLYVLTRNTKILHNTVFNTGPNNNETVVMGGVNAC